MAGVAGTQRSRGVLHAPIVEIGSHRRRGDPARSLCRGWNSSGDAAASRRVSSSTAGAAEPAPTGAPGGRCAATAATFANGCRPESVAVRPAAVREVRPAGPKPAATAVGHFAAPDDRHRPLRRSSRHRAGGQEALMDALKHLIEVRTGYAQGLTGSIGALAFVCALTCMLISQPYGYNSDLRQDLRGPPGW